MAGPRQFIPYPIPLGDGEFAELVLPLDLTQAEADRLCGVIQSLAFNAVSLAEKAQSDDRTARGGSGPHDRS